MWRPSRSLVSSRRMSGIAIIAVLLASAERRQERRQGLHLLLAQLEGRHVRVGTLSRRIFEPALDVGVRVFRADLGEVGADRRPHLADRVAAVAAAVHEIALALLDA